MVNVRKRKESRSRGAAAVEAALVLPILLLVSFGAIKYGWLFLRAQQITNAARYGARVAVRASIFYSDENDNDVTTAIANLMTAAGMGTSGYVVTITCSNGNWYESPVGQDITVEVSVPGANVDIMDVPLFPDVGDIGASVTMAKEGF
jgi:Flp pilus assembly protein TadG